MIAHLPAASPPPVVLDSLREQLVEEAFASPLREVIPHFRRLQQEANAGKRIYEEANMSRKSTSHADLGDRLTAQGALPDATASCDAEALAGDSRADDAAQARAFQPVRLAIDVVPTDSDNQSLDFYIGARLEGRGCQAMEQELPIEPGQRAQLDQPRSPRLRFGPQLGDQVMANGEFYSDDDTSLAILRGASGRVAECDKDGANISFNVERG